MSVLSALYRTYNSAYEKNMVDRTDQLYQQTILLPVYHSSKKSSGSNDMIEITLSEHGEFIKAEWLPKDQIAIFPITEYSIIRAGKVIAPHPLSDELSYLSSEYDFDKHRAYVDILKDWVAFSEQGHNNQLLHIVSDYIQRGTLLSDCLSSLFLGSDYRINEDYSIVISTGEKSEKILSLEKTFATFQIEMMSSAVSNLSVTANKEIHQNYIDYVRYKNTDQRQTKCDISQEETYCVSRHRGLMGNAKLISISNHNETYYGRFDDGEEIVHIGYEVSQKIHLMMKYLLENNQNRRQLGNSCVLINWFSDDIGNEEHVELTNVISPYDDMEEDDEEINSSIRTLGGGVSSAINDYIAGKDRKEKLEGSFYLMLLDKISTGRISVKYFRELPKSELFDRVENWYYATRWPIFNGRTKQVNDQTPSLFCYVDTIFGLENDRGFLECKSDKLRAKTIERLLPCILEQKKIPIDLKNRMLENLRKRSSYSKCWNSAIEIGCSIFKKYQIDYQNKKEVNEVLEQNNQNRSYLYGRLLAVYEKLELDAQGSSSGKNDDKRTTNAERLWTTYTKMPARTLQILENKLRPYKERLKKNNYGAMINYDKITTEIMNQLREKASFEQEMNKALNEDFVFGYYAQKQEFYKKRDNNQKNHDLQIEGGNS